MKRLFAIIALLLLPVSGFAATYYIDNVNGLDNNIGTATDNAWQTVQKVNSSSFSAGDQVLFKRGQEWPAVSSTDYLDVPSSGSPGNPIVFGAYGDGAKPVISGMYPVVGGWTFATPNYWHSTVGVAVYELFWNTRTNRLTRVYAIGDLAPGKFFYDGGANRVYVRDDPTGITTYASIGYYAMLVEDKANVTIQDIHFKNAYIGWRALGTTSVDNVILKDCEVSYNYTKGISIDGPNADSITIKNNTVYQNGGNGIYAYAAAATDHLSNVTIDGNTVTSDPQFVSISQSDFHLKPRSPAINAGVNVGLTRDFEGKPIDAKRGGAPDIGAFEMRTKSPFPSSRPR